MKTLCITNNVEELPKLAFFLDEIADEDGLDTSLVFNLNLALEEAMTNVVMYAYPDQQDMPITLDYTKEGDTLVFCLRDQGMAFDPTTGGDVDITLSVEDRPIGGLGIFLVKQIMTDVTYQRIGDCNVLTMAKQIEG